jgi:hypothetical protein
MCKRSSLPATSNSDKHRPPDVREKQQRELDVRQPRNAGAVDCRGGIRVAAASGNLAVRSEPNVQCIILEVKSTWWFAYAAWREVVFAAGPSGVRDL